MKRSYSIRNILFLLLLMAGAALWFVNRPAEKDIPFIDDDEVEESVQRVGEAIQDIPKPIFSRKRKLRATDSLHVLICGVNTYSEAIFDQYAHFQQDSGLRIRPLAAGWQTCAEQIIMFDVSPTFTEYGQALLNIGALLERTGQQIQQTETMSQATRPILQKAFVAYIKADSTLRNSLFRIEYFDFSSEFSSNTPSLLAFVHQACLRAHQHTQTAIETWKALKADTTIPTVQPFELATLQRAKWSAPKTQTMFRSFEADLHIYKQRLDTYHQLFSMPTPPLQLKAALYEVLLAEKQLLDTYNALAQLEELPPVAHTTLFYEFRAQSRQDTLDANVLIP
ncbi:MAG: hypothetical protein AAFU33_06800 [Bacteroidota bacterium]